LNAISLSFYMIKAEDIVIIGAGPAGVSTSLFLAKAGIPHTLI